MSNAKNSTAMTRSPVAEKRAKIAHLLEARKASIAAVLPKHLTPERLLKVALTATIRTPELLACTPESLVLCVMQAAELGLEAGGILGEAYLVPFKGVCTLIPGYRGLIKLARQSGALRSLEAYVVRQQDEFQIEFGLEPRLVHRPHMVGVLEDKDIVAAYAIARFKDGAVQADVMTRAEIDRIRGRSAAANSGPWVSDFAEMAKKTVVRRLVKYLPLSPEVAKALEHEQAIEMNTPSPVIDLQFEEGSVETPAAPTSRADALKAKLSAADDLPVSDPTAAAVPDADGVVQ